MAPRTGHLARTDGTVVDPVLHRHELSWARAADPWTDRAEDHAGVAAADEDPTEFFAGVAHAAWMSMLLLALVVGLLMALGLIG